MNTATEKTTSRLVITRQFECSRHQGINLVAAFEQALPIIIVRRPAREASRRTAALIPCHQRRAVP
jgi:hypothetical protein